MATMKAETATPMTSAASGKTAAAWNGAQVLITIIIGAIMMKHVANLMTAALACMNLDGVMVAITKAETVTSMIFAAGMETAVRWTGALESITTNTLATMIQLVAIWETAVPDFLISVGAMVAITQ